MDSGRATWSRPGMTINTTPACIPKTKTPASLPGFRMLSFAGMAGSEIHAAHAAAWGHRRTGAAGLLVVVLGAQALELLGGTEQGDAAARDDAFFHSGAGRMHRVINAILALLHLDLGRAADADHRDAACELGKTLLELLTVVVRGSLLDLRLDLRHARLDVGLLAGIVDDGGVLFVDHYLRRLAGPGAVY